ncbi:Chaperonin Cpn60/TCP-1 [Macleaya cordata]|uniref:1-phosphatidylinositol-3-phosphate 5-kinase n=1 Tax=Macleaya cordata TaxID=56857 RepID=A0A200QPB1_MACCD|nr:Chaperonin Cpn60/TCP-1 [Macleaya cordata]
MEEKCMPESLGQDGLTPYETPLISPSISLQSTDSFVSSCSELLVDADLTEKEDANEGAPDTGQEYIKTSFLSPAKGIEGSGTITVEYIEDNITDQNRCILDKSTLRDIEITETSDAVEGKEDDVDTHTQSFTSLEDVMELSHSFDIEKDPLIWFPPEPEDLEDAIEGSVANNDDDDEYIEGTKWDKPSSLSELGEELSGSSRFKEQRHRAMTEVMNGEFKSYVARLLTLAGISSSSEAGENWVDIITSLSWKAALLVKSEAIGGKTIDVEGFVKVKCIATGSRSQSHLIKGLVFKKNTAHKHMRTKYKNPRLLLLEGMLGESSSGLLSFDSMQQEDDNLRSIIEMIEISHPNVVLVEKSVSRDVQESLVPKGITLVFDMKLHRLERIARCTGSDIISSANSFLSQTLKQCDSFHFEKFGEEHNISGEGGKRPSKTLMFIEGCPKSLCCTVLLKGAHSDELKKVKRLVHSAVIVAYHLILETSFLVDQRAMFSTIHSDVGDGFWKDEQLPIVGLGNLLNSNDFSPKDSLASIASSCAIYIPISHGFVENSAYEGMNCNSNLDLEGSSTLSGFSPPDIKSHENDDESINIHHSVFENSSTNQLETSHVLSAPTALPGQLLSSITTSLKKVIEDGLPLISSASHGSFSTYFGFKERESGFQNTVALPITSSIVHTSCEMEAKDKSDDLKLSDGEQAEPLPAFLEVPLEQQKDVNNENQVQHKDDISTVLDGQSILFLMSSQSVLSGTVCEQIHLSRITYYSYFDMSLEQFLCNGLLNQMHRCSACGEPPKAHIYRYMHQSGELTIWVKHLPTEWCLPGEPEGKLWMWSRCLKCKRSTQRVVMSTAARCLSFGKFLELSFSIHSTSNWLSSCGHSLQRDYICFYGLGPMITMFRYSLVNIYTVCMPPPVLEFNNQNGQEWMMEEVEKVLKKGFLLFSEVDTFLQKMGSVFCSSLSHPSSNHLVPVKEFSEVEEMLKQERSDFEAHVQKIRDKKERLGRAVHEILCLNRLVQELVLESYVWDRRLHFLSSHSKIVNAGNTHKAMHEQQVQLQKDGIAGGRIEERRNTLECGDEISDGTSATLIANINNVVSDHDNVINCSSNRRVEIETKLDETCTTANENSVTEFQDSELQYGNLTLESVHPINAPNSSITSIVEAIDRLPMGSLNADGLSQNDFVLGQDINAGLSQLSSSLPLHVENCQEELLPCPEPSNVLQTTPITTELLRNTDSVANLQRHGSTVGELSSSKSVSKLQEPDMSISRKSLIPNLDDSEGWVWSPFSETREAYREDLRRGYSQKFEFINSYAPEWLSSISQLIIKDRCRLHIPLGPDDNFVSLYEGEPTSIIAYALAMLHNQHGSTENLVEEGKKERGQYDKVIENAQYRASDVSSASAYWSSTGSADSGLSSGESVSSEVSYSSFDMSILGELLPSSETIHPEIHLGGGKLPGKGQYSVVCLYEKQFRALRKHCCPCELDYIASLSRCKNWDAKGGKSGSFFVKTLDDRFIVKQIKKTEFDSFLKFAPDYFKYINQSLSSGSQTCLAKILGIYQVIIRQAKSGKDLKYDLMVMENLIFGRNITRLYDLKGAQHGRYTLDADGTEKVFLDQNFVEDMNKSPLFVSGKTKHHLQRAIWNDTAFLTSINVMDYSLLVGVDMQKRELVCGIIDYLRQYTWDKHLETWVKASLVVPKNVSPTVISPKEYKKRFRKFMSTYFLSLPDH